MKFEFMTANRIIFERGSISRVGKLAKEFGKKVLLTTGMPQDATDKVVKLLNDEGLEVVVVVVTKEPSIENLEVSLALARKEKCDVVVGFGGGSAMDTGKIISAMMDNPGEVLDYLEVIGKGKTLINPSVPCIAVPTTSGTGAEVTKNSVLGSITNKVKVSLRSPFLLPKIVLLDPEMTISSYRKYRIGCFDASHRTVCIQCSQPIHRCILQRRYEESFKLLTQSIR
jgi:alcohol dehydrogenase class IV